jgi:hypothetical protein
VQSEGSNARAPARRLKMRHRGIISSILIHLEPDFDQNARRIRNRCKIKIEWGAHKRPYELTRKHVTFHEEEQNDDDDGPKKR